MEKARAINTRRGQGERHGGGERELSSAQCVPHQSYFQRYPSLTVFSGGREEGAVVARLTALSLRRNRSFEVASQLFRRFFKVHPSLARRIDFLSEKTSEMQSAFSPVPIESREG